MLFSPAKVTISGIALWLLAWLFSPLEMLHDIQLSSMVFVFTCYLSILAGICVISFRKNERYLAENESDVWNKQFNSPFFWISALIGIVGILFRVIDRVLIRGISYFSSANELRDQLANTDFSIFSVIGSIIMPICFMPFIVLMASKKPAGYRLKIFVSVFVFCLPMMESIAQLSRIIILMTVFIFFTSVCCLKFQGRVFDRRILLPALGLAILLLPISTAMLTTRLSLTDVTLEDSLNESVYATAFVPNRAAAEVLRSPNSLARTSYEAALPNLMYYLSGIYEFDLAFNRPDGQKFAFGSYIGYPYSRVLAILFGTENIRGLNDGAVVYRLGVFTSFFGPLWVDFGYFSFLILFVMGISCQRLAESAKSGNLITIPIYFFSAFILFFLPMFNFLVQGFGFFVFHGFVLFALFGSFYAPVKEPRPN